MEDVTSVAGAFKHQLETGDREPFEALLAPGAVTWHNHDRVEAPSSNPDGGKIFQELIENASVTIVQHEEFPGGELLRVILGGTVRSTGLPLDVHNCLIFTLDGGAITRIDEYVDPTMFSQFAPAAD